MRTDPFHLLRYGVAVLSVTLATVLTLWLQDYLHPANLALLYAAVAISTRYGGQSSGWVATVLATLSTIYFFVPPYHSFTLPLSTLVPIGVFVLVTLLISSLNTKLQQANQRAEVSLLSQQQSEQEQRRLLAELNSQQQLLEAVLQQMPAALVVAEAGTGRILLANPQGQQLFSESGLRGGAALPLNLLPNRSGHASGHGSNPGSKAGSGNGGNRGNSMGNRSSAHAAEFPAGLLNRTLESGEVIVDQEIELPSGSGLRTVLCSTAPIYNSGQQIVAAVATFHDITKRKQAEEQLRESTAILNVINESTPTLVFAKDRQGRFLKANPATLQLIGKTEAEVIGKTDLDFTPDRAIAEQIMANDRQVMESGQMRVLEEFTDFPHEGKRTYLSIKVPYRDARGQIIGLIAVSMDITDRKQAEAALRQSEERYRYLAESIPQLVWITDAEGRNEYVNQQMCDYTGVSLEQMLDFDWRHIIHPDDLDRVYQSWLDAIQQRTIYESEYRVRRADGVYRWFLARGIPLYDEDGQILKWFGTSTDIHHQKQLEAERTQLLQQEQAAREAAETANRIKDEFLAVLSHELRSPLNPILGWTKLLRSRSFEPAATDRALEIIERNAKLQTQLIEDLLDVSRILRGKLSLNASPVKLVTIVEAALETVRLSAEAKGIELRFAKSEGAGEPGSRSAGLLQVMGDPARLQQVVWNLLSNAVKFTPTGGRVEVRLQEVGSREAGEPRSGEDFTATSPTSPTSPPLPHPPAPSLAQLTITDTGKGIAPEFLPYVFDYFRQADSSTTRRFGGLGLGLAIVKHLVELHGGSVAADSQGEDKGATFTVWLPLLQVGAFPETADTPPASNSASQPLAGLKILVVDDETDMRDYVMVVLQQAGAQPTAVASAAEALAALHRTRWDLLLSDIGMPEMDGYALLRQLRQQPPEQGGEVPAIALTAYAGEYDQKRAVAAGFHLHLPKPVEPEPLVQAVAHLVASKAL